MILNFAIVCLAIALSVTGSLTFWKVTAWHHFYIPIVLFIAGYLLGMFIAWILLYVFSFFPIHENIDQRKKPSKWANFWFKEGITYTNFLARVNSKVMNKGLVPTSQRFLFVCNHRSNFDPMVTGEHFGKYNISWITKPSNMKIPTGGRYMKKLGYLSINRDDPLESLKTMQKAIEYIQRDYSSIGVYPEGTRHIDSKLGNFHEGVFTIALRAKVPIVIATVDGTENIHKNAPLVSTKVRLDIIGVLQYDDFYNMTPKAISEQVRNMMDNHLKTLERLRGEK